ncbi:hypothetical protein Scep_014796 [Stephania cephalantha]|uniref:Uncharacterized protein n=1 Tax=Stephania cephalantha TaxID=152367 RepID=A0AAP0P253_9MAGN
MSNLLNYIRGLSDAVGGQDGPNSARALGPFSALNTAKFANALASHALKRNQLHLSQEDGERSSSMVIKENTN